MTDQVERWNYLVELKLGDTLDRCFAVISVQKDGAGPDRQVWIPMSLALTIEKGLGKARHMCADHLKKVQREIDKARRELDLLPEIEEPKGKGE